MHYVDVVGDQLLHGHSGRRARRFHEPSRRFVKHQLAIADSRLALIQADRQRHLELVECALEPASWRRFRGIGGARLTLKADLYVEIATTPDGDFVNAWFVEVDLGTESITTLLKKCRDYEAYRRTGIEQEEGGGFPLVVWSVTHPHPVKAEARRRALREAIDANRDRTLTPRCSASSRLISLCRCWPTEAPRDVALRYRATRCCVGDALDRLRGLPDSSIDTVLTSPPYFRLRDYAADGQLGLEPHVDEWIDRLVEISAEVHRVLVPTGTFWLNLGDTYATHQSQGAARKSLIMAPERLALRLQQSGWIIRNKIVWAKPNPMPTSIKDRLNCTYEFVYVLAKQPDYFFDLDAIREPHRSTATRPRKRKKRAEKHGEGPTATRSLGLTSSRPKAASAIRSARIRATSGRSRQAPFPGIMLSFQSDLAIRAIQAGCPEARCTRCRCPGADE